MKRWLVGLLVLAALVVFVSPGIVGRLAERGMEEGLSQPAGPGAEFVVTQERFRRGWFSAAGRHRVEFADGLLHDLLAALAGEAPPGANPALVVETRVDHGLVPFTSLGREAGSLLPALARTESTLALDLGRGATQPLPAKLFTTLGVSGATSSRLELEPGALRERGGSLAWGDGEVTFGTDARGLELSWQGAVEEPRAVTDAGSAGATGLRYEGRAAKTVYGYSVGRVTLALDSLELEPAAGHPAIDLDTLRFDGKSEIGGERYAGQGTLVLERLAVPGLGPLDADVAARLAGVHAPGLGRLLALLETLAERDGQALGGDPWPALTGELRTLLSAGGVLEVERFGLTLPEGPLSATLELALPERPPGEAPLQWPSLLLALTGSADLELPVAVAERLLEIHPDAALLVATGMLVRRGEQYVLEARYAQGVVTVNGAPLPIPLPGR